MKANAIKSNKKIIPLLCISSLIFIVFASFLVASGVNYKNKGVKTYAVITRIEIERRAASEDVTFDVYVKFEAEGRIIEGRLDTYVAGMREGQKIPIRYMPDNPRNFTYAKGMFLVPVLLYIMSAVMLLFIIPPIKDLRKKSKLGKFKVTGQKIIATIDEVTVKNNVRILQKSPVTVICSDENGITYRSKFLSPYPRKYFAGANITVYTKDGKYVVDEDSVSESGTLKED